MRCSRSSAASTARLRKTGCCEPTRRSLRRARKKKCRAACNQPPPPPKSPMPSTVPSRVRTARNAAAGIATNHRAARLRPNWRRLCTPGFACPAGANPTCFAPHTCERKSHPALFHPFYLQQVGNGSKRAFARIMKHAWLGCLFVGSLLFAGTQDSDLNVNKRYTVDTVTVAGKGWKTNVVDPSDKISSGLRKELTALIGQKLNPGVLDSLAARIKKEFSAREVSHHVLRGDSPDHVRIEFDVKPSHGNIDGSITKFLYDSKSGWSGAGALGFTVRQNSFLFGLASDGDTLNERFAGISARYENKHLGTDKVNLRFQFESYHEQWNSNTLDMLAAR